ncbi:transposase [Streptomyces sp. NBC_00500]|uniref:transposase n=1 Tax=unclassified Streptomyces TaxID=2593676 RepID=UPI0038633C15
MTALATQIPASADPPAPADGNDEAPTSWIVHVRSAGLPFLHSFTNSLERDRAALDAAPSTLHHNDRTESANNKIKLLKRQTYGRARHALLRQRILFNRLPDPGRSTPTKIVEDPRKESSKKRTPPLSRRVVECSRRSSWIRACQDARDTTAGTSTGRSQP